MIRYTLRCDRDHQFESWFRSGDAFDKLLAGGMVACSICGSDRVAKAVMAPRVRPARDAAPAPDGPTPGPLSTPASPAEQALVELRRRIEAESDYVGGEFAAEARRIHAGESERRAIHGEARVDEARALTEEGIRFTPLPFAATRKTN
ncbi:DUF1178 domain-containing protein [Maritimibacter sp. 55A14]|uniref:DUF1178 family protein n=1 Tax=Maritimibacter sp. 55A14 TaxID=2174844 RepID=UPI000D616665|nr:DUF1178 family protein [Maritimibacter sp. 55A14]PWE33308.1 DUF1178 domain-containing protein [Maritimibacter sp. 55A14]